MNELLVLSSSKDTAGLVVVDASTGGSTGIPPFKSCLADIGGNVCSLGNSVCSNFSGISAYSGDYIAVSQSKKPCIQIYRYSRPQPLFTCHLQEIVTSLDSYFTYLIAGTKNGWIYCWNWTTGELISSRQAHMKSISRLKISKANGQFCVTTSMDGTVKVWELSQLLDTSIGVGNEPFRSWSPHRLPVTDLYLIDTLTCLRCVTSSIDRTVAVYDIYSNRLCLKLSFPESLESLTCSPSNDLLCTGSTQGNIFVVDLSIATYAVSAAHAEIIRAEEHHNSKIKESIDNRKISSQSLLNGLPKGTNVLEGHSKPITAMLFSFDTTTLITSSEDGMLKFWNIWSRQCIRECLPLNKLPITNCLVSFSPHTLTQLHSIHWSIHHQTFT